MAACLEIVFQILLKPVLIGPEQCFKIGKGILHRIECVGSGSIPMSTPFERFLAISLTWKIHPWSEVIS
jgi:hypothetical protein